MISFTNTNMVSAELAINTLLTDVIKSLEKKKKSICIFLDFAKAFDTVNHQILLKKLNYYGIKGLPLKWFESYLLNRTQCVSIGNIKSDIDMIKCGVPQGNDITKKLQHIKFFTICRRYMSII